jgi:PAS domain S-box-containing protein
MAISPAVNWSTQQLTGFLAVVSSAEDERSATRLAVERAAEALEAEVVALLRDGRLVAGIGFPDRPGPLEGLLAFADGSADTVDVPGAAGAHALAIPVEDSPRTTLVLARAAGEFTLDEVHLCRGMASVLGLSIRLFRVAAEERLQRHEAETQSELNARLLESLQERQALLERLARIQRSITHGADRQEVFDSIVEGARDLLGDEVAGLRLADPEDPGMLELVAVRGVSREFADRIRRNPVSQGLGGAAMVEGRLIVSENYQGSEIGFAALKESGLESCIAAPVYEHGKAVGSLMVASYRPGRRYTAIERDMLVAFADHASLALSDTRRIEALRERDAARMNARFRSLVQHSSDMVMVVDPDGTVSYVSPSTERALAGAREGAGLAELVHPEDRSGALEAIAAAARSGERAGPMEWRVRSAGGGWASVETVATGRLADPDVHGVVLNCRDVTERKRLEAELRQSQRLESVGQLAGGVAHDFNNFLSVIRGYARFVIEGLPGDSGLRSDAEEIAKAAERASRLTQQLLVFSRRDVVQSRVLDLSEVLAGLASLLGRTLGEHVELRTKAEPGLWSVEADPTQIEQVLVNLAVNARDAMPGGGELDIELANAEVGGAPHVRLTVSDTGRGMSPEVMDRAFEPFYSTKPKGQGTGLGLATVYGIVTQADGRIAIRSAPGEGTTIEVLLPATAAPAHPEPGDGGRDEPAQGGGETILVVEDEAAVRRLTCRILGRQGYRVLEAPDGSAALDTWRAHAGSIDLLVTDVVMPGMSGKELAERLAELQPGLEPVFMSGYTDDMVLRHGVEAEALRLVEKPFDAEQLLAAVRSALDAR